MGISTTGLIIVVLAFLINTLLGLGVYLRNPRDQKNAAFFVLSICIAGWAVANGVSDNVTSYNVARFAAHVAFALGFLGICVSYVFTLMLRKKVRVRSLILISIPALVLTAVSSTTLVYDLVTIDEYVTGPLYFPYLGAGLVVVSLISYNLLHILRHGVRSEKNQAKIIISGLIFLVVGGLITNVFIPSFTDSTNITKIGPLLSIIFIGSASYAIVRHRLFDVRLVVARSLTYILLLGAVIGFFGFFVFFLTKVILPDDDTALTNDIIPLLTSIFLAILYQPMKRFFDRQTRKMFFRDSYDSQKVLDQFNKVLVSTIEINELTKTAIAIIEENLKPEFCTLHLNKTQNTPARYIGNKSVFGPEQLVALDKFLDSQSSKILVSDELTDLNGSKAILNILNHGGVGLVMFLKSSNLDTGSSSVGYMVIGHKKSGNLYNKQDKEILEIIANELVIAIQNALRFEEIKNFNVTLQQKIDSATKQLKRTNEKLKILDATKDEFISMASHQLRTPLTSVKGYVSMVLDGDAGKISKQQQALLDQAFLSSQRMVYLIADLLNVSRLHTGKFVIDSKPTQLAEVIQGEIMQLEESAKAKNLQFNYHKPKDFPILNLDETKIRQVIMNFADNALYYTPAGGKVDIYLEDKGQSVEFTVVDNGIGVPKSEQHHMFTKFYRANNAQKARPDGTGLGLFMAKKVVVAQGGSIIFRSEEGKGSTFGFSFPKTAVQG
jgi:signal transduction histidine kinase